MLVTSGGYGASASPGALEFCTVFFRMVTLKDGIEGILSAPAVRCCRVLGLAVADTKA